MLRALLIHTLEELSETRISEDVEDEISEDETLVHEMPEDDMLEDELPIGVGPDIPPSGSVAEYIPPVC